MIDVDYNVHKDMDVILVVVWIVNVHVNVVDVVKLISNQYTLSQFIYQFVQESIHSIHYQDYEQII